MSPATVEDKLEEKNKEGWGAKKDPELENQLGSGSVSPTRRIDLGSSG